MTNDLPYGLIACGGRSTRMGTDKSMIDYHGKPVCYYLYDELSNICEKVFLSVNKYQVETVEDGYKFIMDNVKYSGHGPVSGLLSTITQFPLKSILFIGCDYPMLRAEDVKELLNSNEAGIDAVCFHSSSDDVDEPLLALYNPSSFSSIISSFKNEIYSLRIILSTLKVKRIFVNDNSIRSIDTPEQREEYRLQFANE
jgi:molybdenum cofactor guanylyltransferase